MKNGLKVSVKDVNDQFGNNQLFTFEIEAPLYLKRVLSAIYGLSEDDIFSFDYNTARVFIPEKEELATDETMAGLFQSAITEATATALNVYLKLTQSGVSEPTARCVLPQTLMSTFSLKPLTLNQIHMCGVHEGSDHHLIMIVNEMLDLGQANSTDSNEGTTPLEG